MTVIEYETDAQLLEQLRADIEREEQGISIAEDAHKLAGSLSLFTKAAWPVIQADRFIPNWHLDVIAEHLEAVSAGEIKRLQVWVPPGTMKSLSCSVIWPAWEWAKSPHIRYLTGSYDIDLSTRFAVRSRDLMQSVWFRARWGGRFGFKKDENLKRSYANTRGGERFATSPTAGATGRHAHRILIDDPINAQDADASERTKLHLVNEWYDSTLSTRSADAKTHAEVIIMQRLAPGDLCDHVRQFEDWTIVCLPERYEPHHPFVMPANVTLKSGKVLHGDRRTREGELLFEKRRGELESQLLAAKLGAHRAAGQLQQRPAAREGGILKRALWDYYDKSFLEDVEVNGRPTLPLLPRFPMIISSWDTTFKDKVTSDYVAGGIWGVTGGQRYLLRLIVKQMGLSETKASMKELRQWGLDRFPHASHRVLVENTANGPEIVAQLKREIPGVIPTKPSVTADQPSVKKIVRAEACEPDFESGSVFVPGARSANLESYDPASTPAWAQQVIEQAADFPNGDHDDIVDMVTQLLNYAREHAHRAARGDGGARQRPVTIGGII